VSYECAHCDVRWWPFQYQEFDACPKCGGGTRRVQEPGSFNAEAEYVKALAKRRERDERKAKDVAFAEYYAAHCHEQTSAFEAEVREELNALPITEPRRNLAA